jgi:putative cardiolipin synthase
MSAHAFVTGLPARLISALLLTAALLAAGCASVPAGSARPDSFAIPASAETALGGLARRAAARDAASLEDAAQPAERLSGFRALQDADDALQARLELLRRAQVSLDLQYYLLGQDKVGSAVLRELSAAAQRGVRVRLLLDDAYTLGFDSVLLGLAAQPNVEVRLYNPFTTGREGVAGRALNLIGDFRRLNHRMHNKLLVADGAVAIAGGRNLADAYFQQHADANFLDFDMLAVGAIVDELAALFDGYWNSPQVLPIQEVARSTASAEQLRDGLVAWTAQWPADALHRPYPAGPTGVAHALDHDLPGLVWARAGAWADRPDKVDFAARAEQWETTVTFRSLELLRGARSELVLISPYFIPGSKGLSLLQQVRRQRVDLRIVTNAVAANDEPMAGAAYARYRVPLLQAGAELFEISPQRPLSSDAARGLPGSSGASAPSRGGLHAKLAVIDRRLLLLGSMNLDPRSAWTNTELGLWIDSPALARRMGELPRVLEGAGSHRVTLADDGASLQWTPMTRGAAAEPSKQEPDVGWLLRLRLKLLSWITPESLL